MSDLKKISSSPHVRDDSTTGSLMLDVLIALLPATLFGVYNFGIRALITFVLTVVSAVGFEALYQVITKRKVTIGDLSAVVTGVLLALNLPPKVPFWLPIIGSAFAIIVVKQLFGGLGQNFMNPALGARCFLLISFAGYMINFTYDGVSTATPLAIIKGGETFSLMKMFLGTTAGTIGETSAVALLIGGLYLILRRVISPRIPLSYIGTFAICMLLYALSSGRGFDLYYVACEICGGGLLLGAFFMATDYVTSPITPNGKLIFGVCLGLLTFVFRVYGGSAEGVSYAIIICNLLVPIIEKFTAPVAFGKGKPKEEKKPVINKATIQLTLITLVAGICLGGVYMVTKKPIETQEQKAKENAYKAVFKTAKSFEEYDLDNSKASAVLVDNGYEATTINEVMEVYDGDDLLGYVLTVTSHEGYGGDITFAMGVTLDGTLNGISFTSINETAGLGMKAKEAEFMNQFENKNVESFTYTKTGATADNEIDALSGATITTNAVTNSVNAGLCYVKSIEGGSENE